MVAKMTARTSPVLVLSKEMARVVVDTRVIDLPNPTGDELADIVDILNWKVEREFEGYVLDLISTKENGMETEKIHNSLLRIYRSPGVLRRNALWTIKEQSGMEATNTDNPVEEGIERSIFFAHIMGLIEEVEEAEKETWKPTRVGRAFYQARFGTKAHIVIE